MWTRTQILVLSAAVSVLFGCAPLPIPLVRSAAPVVVSPQETQLYSPPPQLPFLVESNAALEAPAQQLDAPEESLPAPTTMEPSSKIDEEAPTKEEAQEKPAIVQNKPLVLRNVPSLSADDRLLELLQKDIDKAVEQPIERRRLEFSKAVIEHARVRYFINHFSKAGRESLSKILARSGRYMPMIARILREEGLPEEFAYLALIESGFSPEVSSPNGAVGLWQFIATTARKYRLRIDSWVDERRDPVKSTYAAAAHLKDLHQYFGKWYLVTAAYNAGQGAIDKGLQTPGAKNLWGLSEKARISDETRDFVPKFVAVSLIATNPGKYGFGDVYRQEPLEYDEVEVRGSLRLETIARMAETELQFIQELNPSLLRNATPPEPNFRVKLPVGKALVFAKAYDQYQEKEAPPAQLLTHEVRRGETLFSIARSYGQKVRALMELNGLTSTNIRIGQKLMVILEGLGGRLR